MSDKEKKQVNSENSTNENVIFRPSFAGAAVIVVYLIASMTVAIFFLEQRLHVTMLSAFAVGLLVLTIEKCPWSKIEEAIIYGGKLVIPTVLILYCIGSLMGSWIASGTVPMIIYWGLEIINPSIFLVTACIACMITAVATGSSWSTIGTVGVALIGVGLGLGINPAMTAGAIVSGAAFGDKMSPMSDTTNIAPAVAEADLFDHIKAMVYTAGPGIAIALIVFFVLGMRASGDVDNAVVNQIMTSLNETFKLNFITLIPPILVFALAIKKMPAFPTLIISAGTAAVIAVVVQGQSVASIFGIMENGFVLDSGFYEIDKLLSRGGLMSMNYTASLGVIVMVFGGLLEKLGVLEVCLEKMKFLTKTVGSLVCTTIIAEILLNVITASQYMTVVLGGRLFVPEYKKKDLLPQTLSRTLEDSGTLTSLLVPWNLCGAFAAASLGVPVLSYLPYAVFNWVVPLIAIIYGYTGLFQWKTGEKPSRKTYRPVDKPNL